MNNDNGIIKGKIDNKLFNAFKLILDNLNMTQQDFIESKVKEFVLENLNLVIDKDIKK